jgi:hypothetical protein
MFNMKHMSKNKSKTPEIKIQKITNVYQEKYLNGNSTGLGDFIRGSIFLLQYCKLYNIECEISLKNHNIYKFLNNYKNDSNEMDLTIIKNVYINCKSFNIVNNEITYIMRSQSDTLSFFNFYIKSINYTSINNNLNMNAHFFPLYENILSEHKEYIKKIFEPNDSIKKIVYSALSDMNLMIKKYKIIHIRCGDKELIENIIDISSHDKILNVLNEYVNDNILIISDSSKIKEKIKIKYPQLHIFKQNIQHIGEGVQNNDDSYISLLVDLLFMSLSNDVLSLSILNHGSGFSEWVSKMNDIPYKCLSVK